MKPISKPFAIKMVFRVSFLFLILLISQSAFASNISGLVYDKQRNPLPDVDVEILDDLYRQMPNGRTKTDGTGRYSFDGLSDGNYTVRVLPFRYDLVDQSQLVEIQTMTVRGQGIGNAYINLDFYLLPKKGGLKDTELSVIFVQDIPKEAKSAYDQAAQDFSKKRDEAAFANLKKALEIFPTYYQALYRYGMELYMRKQYLDSASAFMEAVKINQKSATSFYYLGSSLFNAGEKYHKAAITSLNQAYVLAPASPQVLYMLGKVERATGKFPEAEKHLLQAEKLSTGKVPEIHSELAQLYANDLKKYSEAADELELYMKASKLTDEDEKKIKSKISDL
ncbi:MAG TPA: carboxypeptidase regulatory-like domain-containing protein, partial [Pyrinomonadaceae bacterium]